MTPGDIVSRSNAVYDAARARGVAPHDRVLWGDPARQYQRFDELLHLSGDLGASDIEVLDVGCGNGELFSYLAARGFHGRYRGLDIHRGQVEEARSRFPGIDFRVCNILEEDASSADIVMMSGVFNVDCGQDLAFVERFIARCTALARMRFVFNAITTHGTRRDAGTFYIAPEDAIAIAARLSSRFELRHGFLPFNYSVCIHVGVPGSQPVADAQ